MPQTEEDIAWLKSSFRPMPKPALPDDCVEYSLYLVSTELDASDDSERRQKLRDVQKLANDLQKQHLKDYIWQRQGFALELTQENVRSFLRGRTEYGDSIEDEWVIVWLLRELTKKFVDLWIKISDNDGEFLLIEAADTLPEWLEPETAENRVWMNNGKLRIIEGGTENKLSVEEAHNLILQKPKRITHPSNIEKEAFYRLRNYPGQIKDNMHSTMMVVPRKVAFLLKQKPAYIAPAVEAFYLRDPIALKALRRKDQAMTFDPSDSVTISVKLPRVAYAQLKFQEFPAPSVFLQHKSNDFSQVDDKTHAAFDTGMKATCGFEMLIHDINLQDKPAVREIKMLLEDLETGDESLPTDDEIAQWPKHEDSEAWLDIDFSDLEHEIGASKDKAKNKNQKKPEFNDKATQENLQRIVKQFEAFMNADDAELGDEEAYSTDDEELNSDDDEDEEGEDKDASFAEEDFDKLMQEMMGMPAEVMKEVMHGDLAVRTKPRAEASTPAASKSSAAGVSDRIVEELGAEDGTDQAADDHDQTQNAGKGRDKA